MDSLKENTLEGICIFQLGVFFLSSPVYNPIFSVIGGNVYIWNREDRKVHQYTFYYSKV
jgi:hypothetical protein